jgi:DNA-binding GntR family transcriptional regulator
MGAMATSKKAARQPREESSVERVYLELRDRAMRYDFRPGERINEQSLGRELGVSRPPLREALNRLVAEGFLEFVMNKGFIRKSISVEEVFNLYQVRTALERRAVMLAVKVATDEEIAAVRAYWEDTMGRAAELKVGDLLLADEEFHRRLAALAHNKELSTFLEQITKRIHIARHVDLEQSDWNATSFGAHLRLMDLIARRELEPALAALTEHIDMSLKRAVTITREMVARFFLQDQPLAQEL